MTTKRMPTAGDAVGTSGNCKGAAVVSKGKYTPKRHKAQAAHNTMKAWAVRYVMAGWRVLPLVPGGKAPRIPSAHGKNDPLRGVCKGECGKPGHGVHDATDDLEVIKDWWNKWPTANIGLALGNDLVALDLDPRNGGDLAHLDRLQLDPAGATTARTGGGGWHVIYHKPPSKTFMSHVPRLDGLDVLTGDRYIVAAPSIVAGNRYEWIRDPFDYPPARMPLSVAERLEERRQTPQDAPGTAKAAGGGRYDLQDVERMLAALDPWQDGYDWWVSMGMAVHSEYPGADGLAVWESWADGKPGECAKKWQSFRKSGVTLGTLVHHAKLAGWQPDPKPTPEIWQVKREDVEECPWCGMTWHTPTGKGGTVTVILSCGNKDCPGERKRRAKDHFGRVQDWQSVYLAMIEDGKPWRKAQETARQDAPDFVGLPMGGGDVMFVSPVPVGNYQWQALTPEDAIATLTGGLELMPKGKRIRHAHGKGPRSGKRLELAPELRDLVYTFPHKDMPILEDAYRQSGIRYTLRHGRLASRDALTADQIATLAQRLADIAASRRSWRKVGKLKRMRSMGIGTSPHGKRNVPIHGLGDPVERSTYRQTSLQIPSEVPKSP